MAARHTYRTLSRLARRVASHCASVMAATGTSSDGQIPWFTIRSSRPPRPWTASSTARPAAAGSPRSPVTPIAGRRNRLTPASVSSASALRLRYPTATPAPACASSSAVARPMPLPPPVTNARFPERSITAPPSAEWGMRNAEYAGNCRGPNDPPFQFRIPHSSFQALLHHATNQMLDGKMNFLDPRRVVRGNDQHDVAQVFEPAARMPQEAHDRHPAGLRGLRGADHIGAFPARRV